MLYLFGLFMTRSSYTNYFRHITEVHDHLLVVCWKLRVKIYSKDNQTLYLYEYMYNIHNLHTYQGQFINNLYIQIYIIKHVSNTY